MADAVQILVLETSQYLESIAQYLATELVAIVFKRLVWQSKDYLV